VFHHTLRGGNGTPNLVFLTLAEPVVTFVQPYAKRQAVQVSGMVYFRVQIRIIQMQPSTTRPNTTRLSVPKVRSCICQ
jgi:hypothetical protein